MGEALIATGLSDTCSDAIVILSDTMHGDTPPQDDPKTHKDAVAHKDKDAWLAAERKELRNHEVHKTFELVERPSMENGTRVRTRLIPLQWIYTSRRGTAPRRHAS